MKIKNTKQIATELLFILTCCCISLSLSAQSSRTYIKNAIKEWGECRNFAITKSNGDLDLYGRNGCARSGCPDELNNTITKLNNAHEYIDDVQLTEDGRWLILYGNNGFRWNDIPYSLERKLREFNAKKEVVISVTFNDEGNWIVVTKNYISSSDNEIQQWLKEGMEQYGGVLTVCLTDDSIVAVFEEGYKFVGNVPETLKAALRKTKLDVFRLKIAGAAWFFADAKGNYEYNM